MDKTFLQAVADKRRDILWAKACNIWPILSQYTKPEMKINNRLKTTGGRAWYYGPGFENDHFIDLSAELFWQYSENYVEVIIPHEMGHIVDNLINGYRSGLVASHNYLWQNICEKLVGKVLPQHHYMVNKAHMARKAAR